MHDDTTTDRDVKLRCRNVWKLYGSERERPARNQEEVRARAAAGQFVALQDVSLDIHEGEVFVVMGLSGSGKSTLLRCLARLIPSTFGTVELDGRSLTDMGPAELREVRRRKMGMVFQHFGLLPHLTVAENIALPLRIRGDNAADRQKAVDDALQMTGLGTMASRLPAQLSGGQQQRVGLARALSVGPGLLFLDEPFSALDPLIRRELQDELIRLQASLKKTMSFVTHDFSEAVRVGDRIAIMKDGMVRQIGTPEQIVTDPADDYVRSFVSGMDLTRVIRCGTMAGAARSPDYAQTISADAMLADVADLLSRGGGAAIGVTGADGALVGEVGMEAVLAAISGRDTKGRAA